MVTRIYTAALIAVFSLGLMLVPNETFGRSGGVSGRSSSGFHSSTMRVPIHPLSPNASYLQHRRQFGVGFPLIGSGGVYSYGTYPEPSDVTQYNPSVYVIQSNPPPTEIKQDRPPSYANPEIVTGGSVLGYVNQVVVVYHPGCSSETVTVPWDDGKEHSVNIVRC
jgi:hypothetical protein